MSARGSSAPLAVSVVTLMAGVVVAYGVTAPVPASASAEDAVPVTTVTTVAPPPPSTTSAPPPPVPPEPAVERPVVGVIGDSLAYSVATELDAQLREAGLDPVLDVAPGRQIATQGLEGQISSGLEVAETLRPVEPDVWVVQLGTNDVALEPLDQSRYAFWVIAQLETIGSDAPVVWVNVHRADRPVESAAFDAVLALLDAERSQLRVADWASVAATEPVLAPDGVHLADDGGGRFAGVIVDAVVAALS